MVGSNANIISPQDKFLQGLQIVPTQGSRNLPSGGIPHNFAWTALCQKTYGIAHAGMTLPSGHYRMSDFEKKFLIRETGL